MCGCLASQESATWEHFYTHMLPEDQAARNAAVAEAQEMCVRAQTVLDTAMEHGLSDAFEARDALDVATNALDVARAPVNFPINYVLSRNGTELTSLTVQSWIEAKPEDYALSDDKVNMYNVINRD